MRIASIQRQGPHIPGFAQAAEVLITADGTTPVRLWYDVARTLSAPNPSPLVNGFNALRGAGCQIFCAEASFQLVALSAVGDEIYRIIDGSALNIGEILAALTTTALVARAGASLTGAVDFAPGGADPQMYSREQLDDLLKKTESATFVIASDADLLTFFTAAAGYDFRVTLVLPGAYNIGPGQLAYSFPKTCRYLYGIRGAATVLRLQPTPPSAVQSSINYPVLTSVDAIDISDIDVMLDWTTVAVPPNAGSNARMFRGIELQGQSTIQRVNIQATCTRNSNLPTALYNTALTVLLCADARDVNITLYAVQGLSGAPLADDTWQYLCACSGTAYGAQFCNIGFRVVYDRHNRTDYASFWATYLFRTDVLAQCTVFYASTPEFVTDLSQYKLTVDCIPMAVLDGLTVVGTASEAALLNNGFAVNGLQSNAGCVTLRGRMRLADARSRRGVFLYAAIDANIPGLAPIESQITLRLTGTARRLRPTIASCGLSNVIIAPLPAVALSSVATSGGAGEIVATDGSGTWLRITGQFATSGAFYLFSVDDGATWASTGIATGGYAVLGIDAGQGGHWRVRLSSGRLQKLYFNGAAFTNLSTDVYASDVVATFNAALPADDASPVVVTASSGVVRENGVNTLAGYGTVISALSRGYKAFTVLSAVGAQMYLSESDDNGQEWRQNSASKPYPDTDTFIALLHVLQTKYVIVTTGGVWVTVDAGRRWAQVGGLTLTGVVIGGATIGGGRLFVYGTAASSTAAWFAYTDAECRRGWTVVTPAGGYTRVSTIAFDYMGLVALVGVINGTTATVLVYRDNPVVLGLVATLTLAGVTPVRGIVGDGAGNFMLTSSEASVTNYIMRLCFSTWTHPYITGTGASVHADAYPGQTQIVDNTAAGGWNN